MAFWLRAATLVLGKSAYDISGLDFSFEVPFEASEEPPVATVSVTNLSAKSRAAIKKNQQVILNAGYEGDVGCILVGKVVGLKHKQTKTDWTTTITVLPCADKVLGQRINKTYKRGTKASALIKDLLNIYGVEVGKAQLAQDRTYPRGRVCKGKLINVLTDIVVNECKSRIVTFPTGRVYITKTKEGVGGAIKMSESTGLLRSDEDKVVFEVEKKKETSTEKETEKDLTPRSCLLNYNVGPASVIKIETGSMKGTYTVEKGSHKGSGTGDWVTAMELAPY
ncbi:MAG: hypothetical protein IJ799_01610 [Bacteroidales bacterium]|nr:hypothetical protein [Bacteroidales bacterium]